ncbi:hypothetical protein ACN28S_24775 [Cystobacter fuscus]
MPTRYSPDSLGLAVTEVITNPKKHSHRRLVTSFIVLRFLYEAAKHGRIARGGEILALGSTLQGRKGGVGAGNQFAHQVLRELSIDEVPLHLIAALTARESIVFTYCHASVSQIAARYNETDQLVEQRARTPFIQLAERAINAGVSLQLVDMCMRSLWDDLLDMYEKCCKDSEAAATQDQKGVLKEYLAAVASARKNPSSWCGSWIPMIRRITTSSGPSTRSPWTTGTPTSSTRRSSSWAE